MLNVISSVFYKLLLVLMSLSVMFSGASQPSENSPISSLDTTEKTLSAALLADTQVSDYLLSRESYFKNTCIDISNASERIDALVIAGDLTENGKATEYQLLLDDMRVIDNVDNYIFCVGNHDVRLRAYSEVTKKFNTFFTEAAGVPSPEKLSYSSSVNGITFIVLGTSRSKFEEACFSDEVLAWFNSELAKATADGNPVFVVCHQPLVNTHGLPDTWGSPLPLAGSVGAQSDEIFGIMNSYSNVFFISGHLHSGFGEHTFNEVGNVHCINLPSDGIKNSDGYVNAGTGYMLEVYENSVVFRARDFNLGIYLSEYDITYPLV